MKKLCGYMVDDSEFELLRGYKWPGKRSMDRFIMNCPRGQEVRHIDGNELNNQRNNLRLVPMVKHRLNPKYARNYHQNKAGNYQVVLKYGVGQKSCGSYETTEQAADVAYREVELRNRLIEIYPIDFPFDAWKGIWWDLPKGCYVAENRFKAVLAKTGL